MNLLEELEAYSKACIADNARCCVKHRWACVRFLRDVELAGSDDFPYVFDEARAERFYAWARLHKHTKGILAGKPIELAPIQRFIFGNVFGWVHRETGLRRFRRAYWQVGRKNAKSQSLALVGDYLLMADGEPMSEVYKDDGKTGDGLSPHGGLIDEYHAHPTDEILEVINTGMIARSQPLLFVITTAGSNFGGPCYRIEYPLVEKILNPALDFDVVDYFVMVNELDHDEAGNLLDDVNDETTWIKANPIAASYNEGIANIRSKLNAAIESPEKMESFLTKNMNLWVNRTAQSYIDMEKWKARGAVDLASVDYHGADAYVGIDLSSKIDLTSAGIVIPVKYQDRWRYLVLGHSFIPEDTMHAKEKTDRVPYSAWARAGHLTVTPGEVVDYRYMTEWLLSKADELGVATLSEPTKGFREAAYQGDILHVENPLLDWAISNAVMRVDSQGNIMLDKAKSTNRIDPIASVMNAFTRALSMADTDLESYILSDDFSL